MWPNFTDKQKGPPSNSTKLKLLSFKSLIKNPSKKMKTDSSKNSGASKRSNFISKGITIHYLGT